jgi:eukaryotic-like serine/threonine-protein kinase
MAETPDPNADARASHLAMAEVFAGTQYRVLGRIGRGGMGEVFHVVHGNLRRDLAAKVLYKGLAADPQLLDRVRVEAQALGSLRHDNVVEVTDYFQQTKSGRPFFVTEYLKGRTLQQELSSGRVLSLFDAVDFAHQALSGLAAAHALGIVHRDIKPDNLFLAEDPATGVITVKLIDFGLARVIAGISNDAPLPLAIPTETGAVLGTPRYLSPEAALGKKVDHRADLYSVSVVFYEMVAGCGPFEHLKNDFLTAHTVEDPAPPSHHTKRAVPAQFDAVILRGLQKNPEDRYQTAEEFQLELERLWELLNRPAALGKVDLSSVDPSHFRTTGQLRRFDLPAPVRELTQDLPPLFEFEHSAPPKNGVQQRPRMTAAQIAMFVSIALVTAITMSGLVVALLRRIAP